MPQKACERGIYHVSICIFFTKCPKIEDVHFRFIFCFLIDHVLFFRNTPLFYARFFKCPFFPFSRSIKNRKWTENEHLRFWGISKKMHMPSRNKFLFHMLFGAFNVTSRIWYTVYHIWFQKIRIFRSELSIWGIIVTWMISSSNAIRNLLIAISDVTFLAIESTEVPWRRALTKHRINSDPRRDLTDIWPGDVELKIIVSS